MSSNGNKKCIHDDQSSQDEGLRKRKLQTENNEEDIKIQKIFTGKNSPENASSNVDDSLTDKDSHTYKTIVMQKPYIKFRPLSSVVATIFEFGAAASGVDSQNIISNIAMINNGIVTYSPCFMTLRCTTTDGGDHVVHCPSSVTDIARIGRETVMAAIPFRQKILIINPTSCEIKSFHHSFHKISFVKNCQFVGLELFGKMIYLVDWATHIVESKFSLRDEPTNIAMGPQNRLLVTFANIDRISCYNLKGRQLFQLYSHSLDIPTDLTVYNDYFYVLQGSIIYRISSRGGVSQRDIGINARYVSLGMNIILCSDYYGLGHVIRTDKDFWPRLTYFHQEQNPILNNQVYINDPYNIKQILPMTSCSVLVIYRDLKAVLFTDNGAEICKKVLTFQFQPHVFCRLDSDTFLVLFNEKKKIQCITCPVDSPELKQGSFIDLRTVYIQMCHIESNKCLALTTRVNKQMHILLIEEDKVVIEKSISLEDGDVTIAATPINFVVVDKSEHKLVFYSSFGEELFERYLDFNDQPHDVYSDKLYFYVVYYNRESIVVCHDIYGDVKWQKQLCFVTHSHIGVVEGTICVVDVKLSRILFYKYRGWSSCDLHLSNPYIKHLDIRDNNNRNNKILIGQICHLPNGLLVVSDISDDCLLYISKEGHVVSTLTLPSLATDICRWDSGQIGVTLPLEKELRVIGNLSKRVRIISLSHPYVRVRKLGESRIICFCDKPYHLDIVSIQNHNHGEIISTISVPFLIKSLAIEDKTLNALIVTKKKVFMYNISSKMRPTLLYPNFKIQYFMYGGCIDKTRVYLIDESRVFALNNHNLVVKDHVTRKHLNRFIDFVDVFSRNICVSEMLSSTLYVQDLTVSDKAQECSVPRCLGDQEPVVIDCSVITENNLIAAYDRNNKNIKIITFDGQLLDSIKVNVVPIRMCRWRSNTLAITTDTNQLLTLKMEFPLYFSIYQTEKRYYCIASLSDNLLVCSINENKDTIFIVDIDEIYTIDRVMKVIDLTGISSITRISHISVTANDVIVVYSEGRTSFLNRKGECLQIHYHIMRYRSTCMTHDDTCVYVYVCRDYKEPMRVIRLSHTGEYEGIFLDSRHRIHKHEFNSIDCKGPRFVGNDETCLYVEGLLDLNRERFDVSRLQTDLCYVQVKDIDVSADGETVVCEKANTGNVKIFQRNGKLLCHRNIGTLVGGVCFSGDSHIMVAVPDRREIFQLNQDDLTESKVWQSPVPYGVIWRKVKNTYWCVHIDLTEYHIVQIDDDDKLNVLERRSLLNLDSVLHLPIIFQMNNANFTVEQNDNKLVYSHPGGTSGEIVGEGSLKVRCGNYIASSMSGSDQISVRILPHRTAMFSLSFPVFQPDCRFMCNHDNVKLIMLQDNIIVFLSKCTLIVTTKEGHSIEQKVLEKQPQDICRWTDEYFIVVFKEDKQLTFFKNDLSFLKTINTEKHYNMIYRKSDNELVCAFQGVLDQHDSSSLSCSYADVLHIEGETYAYSRQMNFGEERVTAIGVTSAQDIVVIKDKGNHSDTCWYRRGTEVKSVELPQQNRASFSLAIHDENVYIAYKLNNIYQVSVNSECRVFLTSDDMECVFIYGIHVSDNFVMVCSISEDRFNRIFYYET